MGLQVPRKGLPGWTATTPPRAVARPLVAGRNRGAPLLRIERSRVPNWWHPGSGRLGPAPSGKPYTLVLCGLAPIW